MQEYHKFVYDGPVMEFDRCIASNWHAETSAVSEDKAKSNLTYQFKRSNNRIAGTRITLPGKVKMVN